MKKLSCNTIIDSVKNICIAANYDLGDDVLEAFQNARQHEKSPLGQEILQLLIENAKIASQGSIPMCQDTGFAVFFVELGNNVLIVDGDIVSAINEGVRQGYREGYLRKSICHPFTRKNTGDNTPAIIHIEVVQGNNLKIIFAPKGGGSENMSRVTMLRPSDGKKGIKDFVVQRVKESGANPCPPTVVGVGIGGTFEKAALIAKKALLRPIGMPNPNSEVAALEREILQAINDTGIGPQGLGGITTSLAVHIDIHPCHIASLPVAVNINCHAHRHKQVIL